MSTQLDEELARRYEGFPPDYIAARKMEALKAMATKAVTVPKVTLPAKPSPPVKEPFSWEKTLTGLAFVLIWFGLFAAGLIVIGVVALAFSVLLTPFVGIPVGLWLFIGWLSNMVDMTQEYNRIERNAKKEKK